MLFARITQLILERIIDFKKTETICGVLQNEHLRCMDGQFVISWKKSVTPLQG